MNNNENCILMFLYCSNEVNWTFPSMAYVDIAIKNLEDCNICKVCYSSARGSTLYFTYFFISFSFFLPALCVQLMNIQCNVIFLMLFI